MTFSISARCAKTGMFGLAISSSSPAVAARCAHARAGVGAVATHPHIEHRQLAIIDAQGRTAVFSGSGALGIHATAQGEDAVAAGNLLANTGVPQAMIEAFGASSGHLGDRLLGAMRAALGGGGEAGPVHSAGLLLVDSVSWPVADLRIDWAEDPIAGLAGLWMLYKPQLQAYIDRALDPTVAPRFGVPGDE